MREVSLRLHPSIHSSISMKIGFADIYTSFELKALTIGAFGGGYLYLCMYSGFHRNRGGRRGGLSRVVAGWVDLKGAKVGKGRQVDIANIYAR